MKDLKMNGAGSPYESPRTEPVLLYAQDGVLNNGSNENYTEIIIDLDD